MSAKHPNAQPDLPGIPNRPFPLKRVIGGLLIVAFAFTAAAIFLPKSANAKDAIGLNATEVKQVKQIEEYLNAITTMKSRFMQVTDRGHFAQGEFLMSRPGRMRIDYDPPTPILIVSDGTWVMYKDEELDQISHLPLSQVPASMFVGDNVDFFGAELLITGFESDTGTVRVTVQRSEDPTEGSLTLVFADKPLTLKKWSVIDAQSVTTTVSLLGPQFDVKFTDADLFKVENRMMQRREN